MYVLWYICTMTDESQLLIERVQTGVRMEKRLLKVLKALAEYHDMSLAICSKASCSTPSTARLPSVPNRSSAFTT